MSMNESWMGNQSWTGRARVGRLSASLVGLALLAACSTTEPLPYPEYRPPTSGVETSEIVHVARFATDRAELDREERDALEAFVATLPKGGQLRTLVLGFTDSRASDRYNVDLSTRRANHVAAALRRSGVDDVVMTLRGLGEEYPVDPRENEAGWALNRRVEVRVQTVVVTPSRCGDWSFPLANDPGNGHFGELGCSTRANLERMVADPRDLVRGRDIGPADGVREAGAIQRYRDDRVKAPEAPATTTSQP